MFDFCKWLVYNTNMRLTITNLNLSPTTVLVSRMVSCPVGAKVLAGFFNLHTSTTPASSSLSDLIKNCDDFLCRKGNFSDTVRLIDRTRDDATLYG